MVFDQNVSKKVYQNASLITLAVQICANVAAQLMLALLASNPVKLVVLKANAKEMLTHEWFVEAFSNLAAATCH